MAYKPSRAILNSWLEPKYVWYRAVVQELPLSSEPFSQRQVFVEQYFSFHHVCSVAGTRGDADIACHQLLQSKARNHKFRKFAFLIYVY